MKIIPKKLKFLLFMPVRGAKKARISKNSHSVASAPIFERANFGGSRGISKYYGFPFSRVRHF
jgi:hypothetical protein